MIGRVNSPALFSTNGPAGGSNTVSSFHQAVAHTPYDAVRQDILSRPLSPSLSLTHTSASDTMFSRLTDSTGGFGNRMDDFTETWTSVSDTMTSSSSNWSSDIPDNEVDDVAEAEPEPPDVVQSYQFRGVYFDSVRTIVRPNPRFAANANIYPAMGMAESSVSLATAIDWAETAVPSGVTSMSGSSTPERPLTPPTAMDAVEAARRAHPGPGYASTLSFPSHNLSSPNNEIQGGGIALHFGQSRLYTAGLVAAYLITPDPRVLIRRAVQRAALLPSTQHPILNCAFAMGIDGPSADMDASEWEIVAPEWWRTSFRSISWAFPPTRRQRPQSRMPVFKPLIAGSGSYARPPHYHDLLHRTRRRELVQQVTEEELEPNSALPGVKCAEEAIRPYEIDVGIRSSVDTPRVDYRPLFAGLIEEEELALAQHRWNEQVQGLLGGVLKPATISIEIPSSPGPDAKLWDPLDSPSSVPDLDTANSELSVESDPLPTTPRGMHAQIPASILTGDVASPHPSKPLNAAAVSFIPSAPTPSPPNSRSPDSAIHSPSPIHEFAFPSLTADNPAASPAARKRLLLQKDPEGFYHPVEGSESRVDSHSTHSVTPRRASADLLPAFLADGANTARTRNRMPSRTREMVDRARSGRLSKKAGSKGSKDATDTFPPPSVSLTASKPKEKPKGETSRTAAEGDGWIRDVASDPCRTEDGWIAGNPVNPTQATANPPRTNGHKRQQKQGHKRSTSSTSSLTGSASGSSGSFSPVTPLSNFGTLPQTAPSFAQIQAVPFAGPPPYMQAQLEAQIAQIQAQQWQIYGRGIGATALAHYGPPWAYFPAAATAPPPSLYNGAKGVGMMGVRW
ncbi:predicted protein [Postia placenta Mad-698-R]|uniref:Uncharacterized protein n=1 Tax=Postia placenta MAD-698-R-SB12 TaxID=670580 RepID=A0A1X6MZB5_9APHY|nr:hypothetical protein POSPLADRAFT_1046981 [Postia placenta MAD-698-R-SB12]EED82644.1 predicted protein [Postia placenta Mad-698-R]OSX61697.1 hypothetical protein POSPLADRAFT_1046981 [Postia placenta MAD-698-R-SB12]